MFNLSNRQLRTKPVKITDRMLCDSKVMHQLCNRDVKWLMYSPISVQVSVLENSPKLLKKAEKYSLSWLYRIGVEAKTKAAALAIKHSHAFDVLAPDFLEDPEVMALVEIERAKQKAVRKSRSFASFSQDGYYTNEGFMMNEPLEKP